MSCWKFKLRPNEPSTVKPWCPEDWCVWFFSHFCKKVYLVLKSRSAFFEWKNYLNNEMILKNCIYLYLIAVKEEVLCSRFSSWSCVTGTHRGKIDFKTGDPVGWLKGFVTVSFLQGESKTWKKGVSSKVYIRRKKINVRAQVLGYCIYSLIKMQRKLVNAWNMIVRGSSEFLLGIMKYLF